MTAQLSKGKLQEVLRSEYSLMKPVSKGMTPAQIRALHSAMNNDPELQGAIQVMISERNGKAKTNSVLGSEKSALNAKLYKAVSDNSALIRELDYYKQYCKEQFQKLYDNLFQLEKSEIRIFCAKAIKVFSDQRKFNKAA